MSYRKTASRRPRPRIFYLKSIWPTPWANLTNCLIMGQLQKGKKVKSKWIYPVLVIFAVGTLITLGCGRDNGKALKFSGTLELTEHSLGTKVAGRLATLNVDEGSLVKAGDTIATLDRFEQTQKDYKRWQGLLKAGGATTQDIEYAALALDDQRVISPIDGIVLLKVHEDGG